MDATLISPIPLGEFEASATHIDQAITLPPGAYTRADFHEFELKAVFDHSWLCVGRVDEIPNPGDYFTTTLPGGEKVIVARDKQGEL